MFLLILKLVGVLFLLGCFLLLPFVVGDLREISRMERECKKEIKEHNQAKPQTVDS